ncbi:MAG: cation transporter [Gammaproteobacteria bacterium]|nr:MAG: cation transporter [Gammaproteobacteria bacterium]
MSDCGDSCCGDVSKANAQEKRVLVIVLAINAFMFVAEFSAGLYSHSTALLADSLDMLADALVYALGLYALGKAAVMRTRAALTSGLFQLALGAGISVEVIRKLLIDIVPDAQTMSLFGVLALVANTICFVLLTRYRDGDINMRATWICSRNDMIANLGVLLAAWLVARTGSGLPDIFIGLLIASLVLKSAWGVIAQARSELRSA